MHDQAHRWVKEVELRLHGGGQSLKLALENFVIQVFPGNYDMERCAKTEDRKGN